MSIAVEHRKVTEPDRRTPVVLDDVDRHILALLSEDARMSMRGLATAVSISRTRAYARVERLRSLGVITGFTVRLDPERMGLGVTAHVVVVLEQRGWREALEHLRTMPEVVYCAVMAANVDVLLVVRSPDVASLREVVLERLNEIPGVRRTRTLLVLEDFTSDAARLLEALPEHAWLRAPVAG